jgi:hypothetical protein
LVAGSRRSNMLSITQNGIRRLMCNYSDQKLGEVT